jgi:V/A-type H+-transporting ATPase subunit E
MQNKLQELTDKLYNEGLSKGKQEADEMVAKAKREAATILEEAKSDSERIISQAKKEAADLKQKMEAEIQMAFRQTITSLKNQIENTLISNSINKHVSSVSDNTTFLKELIIAAISAFNPKGSEMVSLSLLLPENKRADLESFIMNESTRQMMEGVEVKFENKLQNGFKIGPAKEGYHISFTDKDLQLLFSEYLKPKTREFLFKD